MEDVDFMDLLSDQRAELRLPPPSPPGLALTAGGGSGESMADDSGDQSRGAVFTRPEIVNFILDLIGYTEDRPLHERRILEPSFGGGHFLMPLVDRLLTAWRASGPNGSALDDLGDAVQAVELHGDTFGATFEAVVGRLRGSGMVEATARDLAGRWLIRGDFLLTPTRPCFDFVAGNPPYVRPELIPPSLLAEYRSMFATMFDRADLYIPFIHKSLEALTEGGRLGFICSDRWMKNRYGGPLRNLVSRRYHFSHYVDMVGVQAFHDDVMAYPAITVIARGSAGPTRAAYRPEIGGDALARLAESLKDPSPPSETGPVREIGNVVSGREPWLLGEPDKTDIIRRVESRFPPLEQTRCKVGIGVATGADKEFIGDFEGLDVEPSRKLPLALTDDILSGEVVWSGRGVVNPFSDSGGLVDLAEFPRLRRYLEARRETLAKRHCARKAPTGWYRTIDRITPALAGTPKLLIPDIKSAANVVFEKGELYPSHNLYYVLSLEWDLRALQAVLLSKVTHAFVTSYSTQIKGGFIRFQAQYLRRLRLPRWSDVPIRLRGELAEAAVGRDAQACDKAAFELYGLSPGERATLGEA